MVYAGKKILGSFKAGVFLFISQLLISFFIGLFSGAFKITPAPPPDEKSLLGAIVDSLSAASLGGLTLTGYITFFAMLASLLNGFPFFEYLYGFLELTGGLRGGFYIAGAMVGFSGCSAILQNAAYLEAADLPILPMLAGKLLYMLGIPIIGMILNLF